uniref:Uncharacterized protein n=1 Tax=Ascaris lumbricoides TaxID=6252 RepID=A0A0M3IQW4_ASCLU
MVMPNFHPPDFMNLRMPNNESHVQLIAMAQGSASTTTTPRFAFSIQLFYSFIIIIRYCALKFAICLRSISTRRSMPNADFAEI